MHRVSDDVRERIAVAQDRAPRLEWYESDGARSPGDAQRCEEAHDQRSRHDRTSRSDEERGPPPQARGDGPGESERQRGADAERGRVEGDRSALLRPGDPIR